MTEQSAAFKEFRRVQRKLNYFLWSTEIAVGLVKDRVLKDEILQSSLPVNQLFPELTGNAFKAPANKKYPVKYARYAWQFDQDLEENLSSSCKLVIVRFHRALERFLEARFRAAYPNSDRMGKLFSYVGHGGGPNSVGELRGLGIPTLQPIPHALMLNARIYAEVRHNIAHGDGRDTVDVGEGIWVDTKVRDRCMRNEGYRGPMFERATDEDIAKAVNRVCGGAQRKHEKTGQPLIFFYALFCFGAYRKLVEAVELAFPRP